MKTKTGKGISFRRIRRVCGFLAGDVKFLNDAKRAEVAERIKHIGLIRPVCD